MFSIYTDDVHKFNAADFRHVSTKSITNFIRRREFHPERVVLSTGLADRNNPKNSKELLDSMVNAGFKANTAKKEAQNEKLSKKNRISADTSKINFDAKQPSLKVKKQPKAKTTTTVTLNKNGLPRKERSDKGGIRAKKADKVNEASVADSSMDTR